MLANLKKKIVGHIVFYDSEIFFILIIRYLPNQKLT